MPISAHIHASLGNIPGQYYTRCPQDSFGTEFIPVRQQSRFSTIEQLVEQIAASHAAYNLIVCHGHDGGLAVDLSEKTGIPGDAKSFTALMNAIASAAESFRRKEKPKIDAPAGVKDDELERIARKAAAIKRGPKIIVRGCSIGKTEPVLRSIGRVFGGSGIDAPKVPQIYVSFNPNRMTIEALGRKAAGSHNAQKKRYKLFFGYEEELGFVIPDANRNAKNRLRGMRGAGALLVEVEYPAFDPQDAYNQHYAVSDAWATEPGKGSLWGEILNHLWYAAPAGPAGRRFIGKILWVESTPRIIFPAEGDYQSFHRTIAKL